MRKVIVPPMESELSFSTGTFLNNHDVIERKLQLLLIHSTVGKRAKRMPDSRFETTKRLNICSGPNKDFRDINKNYLQNKRYSFFDRSNFKPNYLKKENAVY